MAEEDKVPAEGSVDEKIAQALEEKEKNSQVDERVLLLREFMSKETFIDPLNPDHITKAYAQYDKNPGRMIQVLIDAFQGYCRKVVRETAVQRVKNESALLPYEEAENLKRTAVQELSQRVQSEVELEQLLAMLLFKNHFWAWLRFGLKDIFNDQRKQPGHSINTYLNIRFHKFKASRKFHTVADLVAYDLTEIVNSFKSTVLKNKVKIFDPPSE